MNEIEVQLDKLTWRPAGNSSYVVADIEGTTIQIACRIVAKPNAFEAGGEYAIRPEVRCHDGTDWTYRGLDPIMAQALLYELTSKVTP
jgi:hypothetical protein